MAVAPVMGNVHVHSRVGATSTNKGNSGKVGNASSATDGNSDASSATGGTSASDLMNNFMQLLVAQMQNQDPTNPMDNNQMTSQLAQFNTAAGVEQLNSTLNSVGMLVTSMQQMNAAEWVGRSVLVEGTPVIDNSDTEGANKSFSFALDNDADNVEVTLTDKEGNAYTAELKNQKAGTNTYSLDDLSDFKPSAPPEGTTYDVSFSASNDSGDVPTIVALKKAKVESVSFTASGALLQLGVDGTATLGQVYEIE